MKIDKHQYFIQDNFTNYENKRPSAFMLFKIFNNQKSDKQ